MPDNAVSSLDGHLLKLARAQCQNRVSRLLAKLDAESEDHLEDVVDDLQDCWMMYLRLDEEIERGS